MTIYCAREFSASDIQTIRHLIAQDPKLQRSALSRKLCQLWGWVKPNGELKDMTCRVALLRMQADGLISLPPSRIGVVRKRAHFAPTTASDAQAPIKQPVHEIGRITLQVVSGKATSLLWNEYMARYHYLGYAAMSGSQIRYNVFAGEQLVACISFCACAWKLKDREVFIGWSRGAAAKEPAVGDQQCALLWFCPGSNPKAWPQRFSPWLPASCPGTGSTAMASSPCC
jgi:hypothetical protein